MSMKLIFNEWPEGDGEITEVYFTKIEGENTITQVSLDFDRRSAEEKAAALNEGIPMTMAQFSDPCPGELAGRQIWPSFWPQLTLWPIFGTFGVYGPPWPSRLGSAHLSSHKPTQGNIRPIHAESGVNASMRKMISEESSMPTDRVALRELPSGLYAFSVHKSSGSGFCVTWRITPPAVASDIFGKRWGGKRCRLMVSPVAAIGCDRSFTGTAPALDLLAVEEKWTGSDGTDIIEYPLCVT